MLPFLTAYDPLGGTSGSIDPLGALQTYGALADLLLPGVTTITTRSRYLSMLCRALRNAEERRDFPLGSTGLNERRKAVEPFERLWALACVAAREQGLTGAVDGLRGITYAVKSYADCLQRGKVTPDFKLLKYQNRTGAVGTYWTALIGGELANADTGTLMPEGQELGDAFPDPPLAERDLARLANPVEAHRVSLDPSDLTEWAQSCHLSAASDDEREKLGEALTASDRRSCVAQALEALDAKRRLPDGWDVPSLRLLQAELGRIARADALDLPIVIEAIIQTEQFHEAALGVFDTMLWWGTERPAFSVDAILAEDVFKAAAERTMETAHSLIGFSATCERRTVRLCIEGLTSFAKIFVGCASARQILDESLHRHRRVQSGKLDGGMPKREWIGMDAGDKLLRPSPRFQRSAPPPMPEGISLTHPYRIEQFAFMLAENGILSN